MSEIWDKPITDTTDWGGDSSTGGLPVSGRQVQAWLKSRIAKILTEAQITKIIKDWVQENGFADDEGFVTLSSDQEINGLKNFLQGLMVNGGLVKYDPELKVWQLTGNLLVSGGISMYSNLEGFKPSTIMDGILTDEVTITVKDGRLTVLAAESGLNYDELDAYLKKYEYTTISEVDARISELVNGAPQAYDTLKEIADVLQGNVNSIGDILATLAEKANTTYVDEAIADTKTWVEEQQYINEIDPSYIEAALGYQPYDGDTNRKEFTTKTYVKDNFVSRTLANEIEAIHNFLNGFTIAGIPFRKTANGQLFIDASVVFGGGVTMYGTDSTPAPSIFDGLPIDNETIYWDNGVLKAMGGGGGGGVADSVAWANVVGKPTWITNSKPTYNYSEIQGTPDLSGYFLTSNFTKANIKSTLGISDWALASVKPTYTASEVGAFPKSGGTVDGALAVTGNLKVSGVATLGSLVRLIETDGSTLYNVIQRNSGGNILLGSDYTRDLYIDFDIVRVRSNGTIFSREVTAPSFKGALTGNADSSSKMTPESLSNFDSATVNRFFYTGFQSPNGPQGANYFTGLTLANESSSSTYKVQLAISHTGALHTRYKTASWGGWSTLAFTSDNVASATKLATPRTIWGQSFDGTGNVSGDMSGVGKFSTNDNGYLTDISNGGIKISLPVKVTGGWEKGLEYKHLSNEAAFGYLAGAYGVGTTLSYYFYGGGYGTGSHAMRLYDANQNYKAVFNGNVTAPTFTGNLVGNANSATKLATPRTIWGHSFDGTGDVSGAFNNILNAYRGSSTTAYLHITNVYADVDYISMYVSNLDNSRTDRPLVLQNGYGNVAIGGTTASAKLHVHGNLLTTGGITMYSQRSLKNILSYDGLSLEQLSIIKPIKFTWKDGRDNRYHVGGVADDMATVVPEVVYSANDFLTMDYGNAGFYVAASLIKPVIDHEQRIKILEQENKALREEINQLRQSA